MNMRAWGRRLRLATCLVAGIVLCGCAAQSAYDEGRRALERGEAAQAMRQFQEAVRLAPGSAEYRLAVERTRAQLVGDLLAQGAAALQAGRLDEADRIYTQALGQTAADERALEGLRRVEQARRFERSLTLAEQAGKRNDWDEVRQRATALLTEQPSHRRAKDLLARALEAKAAAGEGRSPDARLSEAMRKPISIEFREAPLKTIFEVISRSSGLNFAFDKDVKTDQKASIFMKDSTIEAAVNMLLLTNQLEQRVIDANTVLIYPATAPKQKDYQPLTIRSFYLANADAKAVAASLKTLLKLRDASVDEKLNLVIVRDTPETIRLAERIVALHDLAEPEVMLDVEILEVKRTRLMDLGIRWPDQLTLTPLPSTSGGTLTVSDLRGLNGSGVGAAVGTLGISAKKSDSDANILANPRIRARNHEKAKIHIGERVPNITTTATATGFVAESVNYVDVGLKLDVEPTVYLDDDVAIKVSLEVSSIIGQTQTRSGTQAYQIGTRTASTVLRLRDGENQVLAGLISDEDRRTADKIPGLGEAPVLGRLFGGHNDSSAKTEILLSITPRVVRNVRRLDFGSQQFESGTESNARSSEGMVGGGGVSPRNAAPLPTAAAVPAAGSPGSSATPVSQPLGGSTAGDTNALGSGTAGVAQAGVNPVSARWDGASAVRLGEVLSLQLVVRSDTPLSTLPMTLGVDPRYLQVVRVLEGPLLRQDNAVTTFSSQVDPAGKISVNAARTATTGVSGEGVVLTLMLKAVARPDSGQTQVSVSSLRPANVAGNALAVQMPASLDLTINP